MGRRRRRGRSKATSSKAAVTNRRVKSANRVRSSARAQTVSNRQGGSSRGMAQVSAPSKAAPNNTDSPQNLPSAKRVQARPKARGLGEQQRVSDLMQRGRVNPSGGGSKGAQGGLQERFTKAKQGRGRGKMGQGPIDRNVNVRDSGGGFRNRAFGMGREQRGLGMGRQQAPDFSANKGFGMGRDNRASGMGRQEMMQNRGYNSSMQSKGRPQQGEGMKGGQMGRPQPEGRPMNPDMVMNMNASAPSRPSNPKPNERNVQAPMSPRAGRGSSSFNPSTGRMEYASQPNNFSRSSQRPAYGGFRKNMGTTQGAFKLPTKSQIKK